MHILLSNRQAGPGRTVKQEQEQVSRNHEQTFSGGSVLLDRDHVFELATTRARISARARTRTRGNWASFLPRPLGTHFRGWATHSEAGGRPPLPAAMSVCTDQQPSASVADQLGGAEEMGASKEYVSVRVRTAVGYILHPDKFQDLSKLDLQKKFDLLVRRGIIVTYVRVHLPS